ncbi:F-box protein: endocytic membrane traffic, recycling ReCYcling 1, partial [Gonapodya sp. JEL0774]
MWNTRTASPTPHGLSKAQEQLKDLPPDLVIRILAFLPVPELPKVARLSRRFKVLCYNDGVFEPKLRTLGVPLPAGSASNTPGIATPPNSKGRPNTVTGGPAFPSDLVGKKLKNLKGGDHLPSAASYLGAGTIWGSKMRDAMANVDASVIAPYATPNVPKQRKGVSDERVFLWKLLEVRVMSPLAGQLFQAAKSTPSGPSPPASPSAPRKVHSPSSSTSSLFVEVRMPSREQFRAIYEELKPYYLDFRSKPDTSAIFKDFSKMEDIATTLHKMFLFCGGRFFDDYKTVAYAVQTTLEYFESSILGQFEAAYNRKDYTKMKEVAYAAYRLNGGQSIVQLFITKNPIFFDEQSNPTLIRSESAAAPRTTVALADQFGTFMQRTLENVKTQASVIRIVFPREMEAMTTFISSVFEQSIAEYLAAVLIEARAVSGGQGAGYLHTLATTVKHTGAFLDFIGSLEEFAGEQGHDKVAAAVWNTYKPYYATYLEEEIASLNGIYAKTVENWNKSRTGSRSQHQSTDNLFDGGNADAHKRNVMAAVKSVLMAPHYLSKQLLLPILKLGASSQDSSQKVSPVIEAKEIQLPPTPDASPVSDTVTVTASTIAAERVQEKEKIKKLHLDE